MNITKYVRHYDGTMLHHRFAYNFFKDKVLPIGNIVAFRGSMEVTADGMIDQEDVNNRDFIYSRDSVNFLWEIPLLGNNSFGAISYQRLLCANVGSILGKIINAKIDMRGDDIYVLKEHTQRGVVSLEGKCSVSITHLKDGAALGHLGINVVAGDRAPVFAYSTNMDDKQVDEFIETVIKMFYEMNDDIFVASAKIISK